MNASQLRAKLREAERKRKQAIDGYNREVRKHNQQVTQRRQKLNTAVNEYNTEVRKHNARVRSNRARLRAEVSRLESSSSPRYQNYRTSTAQVTRAYQTLDSRESILADTRNGAEFLDLSEKEAADTAASANYLSSEDQSNEADLASAIDRELLLISEDLDNRWKGALFALSPKNPDAARHFCAGAREILIKILDHFAPNASVEAKFNDVERTAQGQVTRKSKIRYLLVERGIDAAEAVDFVDEDMENILKLFGIFNSGTHGEAGKYALSDLRSLKERAEQGVLFLCRVGEMC